MLITVWLLPLRVPHVADLLGVLDRLSKDYYQWPYDNVLSFELATSGSWQNEGTRDCRALSSAA
jgi:hypothetical protein